MTKSASYMALRLHGYSGWHLEVRACEVFLACRELGLRVLLLCLGHATTAACASKFLHRSPECMAKDTHSTDVRREIKSKRLQLRVFRQERHELVVLLSLYL